MSLTQSPKMQQKLGEYLLAGEYVMINNHLCLVVATNWPFLVISRFANGEYSAPETYRIVKEEYYYLPAPEFVFAMGAMAKEAVLEKSKEFVVLVDDTKVAQIPRLNDRLALKSKSGGGGRSL